MDPNVVLFAIEAGVRLGRRLNDALIDATTSRPLLLPVGELFGAVIDSEAIEFFDRDANQPLIAPGGPYADCDRAQLITAYRTLIRVEAALGGHEAASPRDIILQLHAFDQLKRDPAATPFLQRVIGEIVNLGIDYFTVNPSALGRASPARTVIQGLLREFDAVDFATMPAEVLADGVVDSLLHAALSTLQDAPALLADNARLQALLGGVTRAALDELGGSASAGERLRRHDLLKRTFAAALQGGAAALDGHLEVMLPAGAAATPAVRAAFRQVLAGIRAHPTLFPNDAVLRLVQTTLGAVAARAAPTGDEGNDESWVEHLIASCTRSLLARDARELFDTSTLTTLVDAAIRTATRHVDTLAHQNPALESVFARALDALGAGFAAAPRRSSWPTQVLLDLARGVFEDVARDPVRLLGTDTDPRHTALAQIVGSVASVLGVEAAAPLSAQGRLELLRIALATATQNIPRLLDLGDPSARTNPLFTVLQPLVAAWHRAPPELAGELTLIELTRRLLPLASAQIGALHGRHDLPGRIATRAFELATGVFAGRVDAATLPALTEGLLREVLWEELDLDDAHAVQFAARRILRAA